ncbi:hypothetical protein [Aquabacterium sp.]|uniref:hypothetical protein n=1 Tax=Aquabacterium sp. TaxID=1872578 RepID=UPI0035B47767
MNHPTTLRAWLVKLALTAAALLTFHPAHALRVDMYAIGNWSAGDCDTNAADNRPDWPGMAQAWWSQMGAQGHSLTGKFVDGNTSLARFCDPSVDASCTDWAWVDWPDAAITAFHGGNDGNAWSGLMRKAWKGSCNTRFGGTSPNMKVGDSSLKILHASSCRSAEDTYLPNLWRSMDKGNGKRLHLFTGFHGCMWISSGFNNDYKQTAIDGQWGSVASAWVHNHHKTNINCAWYDPFNVFGTCTQQCPVAVTIGASSTEALTRLYYESYGNAAYWSTPSGHGWYAWMGYVGCTPQCVDHAFHP